MARFSDFTDIPTNAGVAFAAAGFGALMGNLTEGLPWWGIGAVIAMAVLGTAVALLRQRSLKKQRRTVSREERAFRDNWFAVNQDDLEPHKKTIQQAASLKWNGENPHWDDIVEWIRQGAPDPVSGNKTLDSLVWDNRPPEDAAAQMVVDGIFVKFTQF